MNHFLKLNLWFVFLWCFFLFSSFFLNVSKFYEQFHTSLEMQKQFGSTDKDIDDLKLMLFETNPYLLGLTVAVTLLHTVFDVLAFKNGFYFPFTALLALHGC